MLNYYNYIKPFVPNSMRRRKQVVLRNIGRLRRKCLRLWPSHASLTINQMRADSRLRVMTHKVSGRRVGGADPTTDIIEDQRLPALSWRGVLSKGALKFVIGPNVENFGATGFFEGIWSGKFEDFESARQAYTFGSGALISEHGVMVLVPKHPLEQIFLLRESCGTIHIANSLCHCLASAGVEVDTPFFDAIADTLHARIAEQTRVGAIEYDPHILSHSGRDLFAVFYNNFRIYRDGKIEFIQPYLGKTFNDFLDYRTALSEVVGELIANATHPNRSVSLLPAVTVSKGYDSPAVAVLTAENGCRDALCLDVTSYGVHDSGASIAESLGLRVSAKQHFLGSEIEDLAVQYEGDILARSYEFVATAGIGDDMVFSSFEADLSCRTLFTGDLGDTFWSLPSDATPGIPSRTWYGKSLTEFRLRLGFAHVPAPSIHAFFPKSLTAISSSPEMRPFSIGGKYNRPIPRRIVETAGIARDKFALSKAATSPNPINREKIWPQAVTETMKRYSNSIAMSHIESGIRVSKDLGVSAIDP